jgi:hypothetical protein
MNEDSVEWAIPPSRVLHHPLKLRTAIVGG